MNTITKEEAIKLNIKVWARRMGVSLDVETAYSLLQMSMAGSVLRGPLKVVFFKYLERTIGDRGQRLAIATICSEIVTKRVRDAITTPTLQMAAEAVTKVNDADYRLAFARYAAVIGQVVDAAVAARSSDKAVGGSVGVGRVIAKHVLQQRYH